MQYQYNVQGTLYYYGGSDPRIQACASEPITPGQTWGRINGYAFASGGISTSRAVENEPIRVFNDFFGCFNAHFWGFTPADAMNDAYASVPRYFVKRDLLNAAVPSVGGGWTVPAQAQPIRIYKSNGTRISDRPASMPRPLMIIPKDALEKAKPSDRQLVRAN